MRVLEREGKEKWAENLFEETMVKIFPNLGRNIDIQVREIQNFSNRII